MYININVCMFVLELYHMNNEQHTPKCHFTYIRTFPFISPYTQTITPINQYTRIISHNRFKKYTFALQSPTQI